MNTEEFFDNLAIDWDNLYKDEVFYSDRLRVLQEWVAEVLLKKHLSNKNILDIGCGTGQAGKIYSDAKLEVIGIDISREMLNRAANKGYKQLIKFDGTTIPVDDRSISAVQMFNVIEFVDEPELLLKETFRVLENGGVLLITITNYERLREIISVLKNRIILKGRKKDIIIKQKYNYYSIRYLLKKAGFSGIKIFKYGISPNIKSTVYKKWFSLTRNHLFASSIYLHCNKEL